MKTNKVIEKFKKYGFEVEPVGEKGISFIATDDRFCIPVTVVDVDTNYPLIDAQSFARADRVSLIENYGEYIDIIGRLAYSDYNECRLKDVSPLSGMSGAGLSLFEVEGCLMAIERRRRYNY